MTFLMSPPFTNLFQIFSVDCVWSSWFPGECSKSCGGGERMNTRYKKVAEAYGGHCSGDFNMTESCNTNICPGT